MLTLVPGCVLIVYDCHVCGNTRQDYADTFLKSNLRVYCLISNSRLDKRVLSRFPSNSNFPLEIKSSFPLQTAEADATRD